MRARTSTHQLRAGRLLFKKRQDVEDSGSDGRLTDDSTNQATTVTTATDDEGGFTLTGPITLTITREIDSSSSTHLSTFLGLPTNSATDNTSASVLTVIASSSATPSSSTTAQATTFQSPTQTSSSTFISTTMSSTTASASQGGNSSPQNESAQSSNKQLPAGSIVGIVVACLFVLAIALIYLLRVQLRRRRRRVRNSWVASKIFETTMPTPITSGQRNGNKASGNGISSNMDMVDQNNTLVASRISIPPNSYNNDAMTAETGYAGTSVYAMSAVSLAGASLATVTSTFKPTLPDELTIRLGQLVRILATYDDGWALCANLDGSGEQGMVPLECLDRRNNKRKASTIGKLETNPDVTTRGSRRISSLPAKS